MESHLAIHDFMEKYDIKSDQFGNLSFQALVEYKSPARNSTEVTGVTISRNGYNDGSIGIDETSDMSANDYHLDFTTDYQQYRYSDEKEKLIITGNSPKMGGGYSVSLLPA
jgi:hypothetical protein